MSVSHNAKRTAQIYQKLFHLKRHNRNTTVGMNNVNVFGGAFFDLLVGSKCADVMVGYAGNDTIWGGAGNDQIYAGSGNDLVIGGVGQDLLKGDGGSDIFQFSVGDSPGAGDHILDFSAGDKIGFLRVSERTVSQKLNTDGNLEVYYGTLGSATEFSNKITFDGIHHLLAAADFVFL